MHRLMTLSNVELANAAAARLADEGIAATVTTEHSAPGLYLGLVQAIIWINEQNEAGRARRIVEETLTSPVAGSCPQCGYSLSGHSGRATCPECGAAVTAPAEPRTCRTCGEESPGNFDVCWSCGADLRGVPRGRSAPAATVRLAVKDDVPAILAISNHYALTTPANFAVEPESLESWQATFTADSQQFPWFVATAEDSTTTIAGFAKASRWKGRCAYDWSAETTVYLDPAHVGRGIGRALYDTLISTLRAQGYCTLLGGITLPNPASVALHESFGFRRVAVLERIGWKFGHWHDVGYWQLQLRAADDPPGKIKLVQEVLAQANSSAP